MSEIEQMVDEFFKSPTQPVTNHQEWLLRTCAQLMEREAKAVSVVESRTQQQKWKRLHPDSGVSTEQCKEMGLK